MYHNNHVPANKSVKLEHEGVHNSIAHCRDASTVCSNALCSPVTRLPDDIWLHVFSYLDTADRIRIARVCRRWKHLARITWKGVKRLSFESLFKLEDDDLESANSDSVSPSRQLTDDRLASFLQQCGTGLRCLDLTSTSHCLTARALDCMGRHGTTMQELHLQHIPLDKSAVTRIGEIFTNLQYLTLKTCSLRPQEEAALGSTLQKLPWLKSLNVAQNEKLTGKFLSQAPPSLSQVHLSECRGLTDRAVCRLAQRCPNLETVDIGECSKLTGRALADLTECCPKLSCLWFDILTESRVGSGDFQVLGRLQRLEEVRLDGHGTVTDEVVRVLARHCPRLQSVSCQESEHLTDLAVAHLSRCPDLECIDFGFCEEITDNTLFQLSSGYSKLKKLSLSLCTLITDKGVNRLVTAHPNMECLNLMGCEQVTDDVLRTLDACLLHRKVSQPLLLYLRGTSINPDTAAVLQRRRNVVLV